LEVVQRFKKKTGFDFWLGAANDANALFQGLTPPRSGVASSGNSGFYFNAKAQRRQDAKQADFFFAPLRLGVFALNPFASAVGNEIFSVVRGRKMRP
jgi:hypothetical protein